VSLAARIALLLAAFIGTPAAARAAEQRCVESRFSELVCTIIEVGGSESSAAPARATRAATPRENIILWPVLVYRDGVGMCLAFQREVFEGANSTVRARDAEFRTLEMIALYDMCPGVERPSPSPAAVARQVVEEFLPPPPQPEIDPGYAITGKPAYLETNGNLAPGQQRRATVLGDIEVRFRGTYVVDWGDGTAPEEFTVEGEPWPNGRITHVYQRVGRYDVVVTARWVAEWRIGSTSGRIDDNLASVGRIEGFEVRQMQAVRDR
jgi:hypothetical protein